MIAKKAAGKKKTTKKPAPKKAKNKRIPSPVVGARTTTNRSPSKKKVGKASRVSVPRSKPPSKTGSTVRKGRSASSRVSGTPDSALLKRRPDGASAKLPPAARGAGFAQNEPEPLPRTHLSDKQLEEFKRLLLAKRAEIVGDVTNLTEQALYSGNNSGGDRSSMPIHMADLGSDNWEQEFTLGLIANERSRLREIDEALERIANKTYGICLATRKRITLGRLRAKPWARYCIEYARLREEGKAP